MPPVTQVIPNPVQKLSSALTSGAPLMYWVLNYQQGPVFSSRPDLADYSGLWQVVYIRWKFGVMPRPITSHLNLPTAAEADFIPTAVVVNDPIMAIGPLGGPWTPAPTGTYRIRQALSYNLYAKTIELPAWSAFGRDPVHRTVLQNQFLITDVSDPVLAELLLTNYAPGLNDVPDTDTQKIWIFDWTQDPAPPPGQLPVLENIIRNINGLNVDKDYSPVMQLNLLRRVTLPPQVFSNPEYIQSLLPPNGAELTVVNDQKRLNVLLIDYHRWTNGPVTPVIEELPFPWPLPEG